MRGYFCVPRIYSGAQLGPGTQAGTRSSMDHRVDPRIKSGEVMTNEGEEARPYSPLTRFAINPVQYAARAGN